MADPQTPLDPVDYYTTIDRVESDLNVTVDESQHALISSCLAAATGFVTRLCNRSFFATDETRLYWPEPGNPELLLNDTISVSTVRQADRPGNMIFSEWETVEDWMLLPAGTHGWPANSLILTDPSAQWTRYATNSQGRDILLPQVEVTGRFGWEAVPAAIEEATRLLAVRYMTRHLMGTDKAPAGEIFYIDPDVRRITSRYKRITAAGDVEWVAAPARS